VRKLVPGIDRNEDTLYAITMDDVVYTIDNTNQEATLLHRDVRDVCEDVVLMKDGSLRGLTCDMAMKTIEQRRLHWWLRSTSPLLVM
jgi:hypothetical protein